MQVRQPMVRKAFDVALETAELSRDHPLPDDVLLQTEASFISAGTELAIYSGVDPKVTQEGAWCKYPFKPGYASVARVLEAGTNVKAVQPGDRVFTFAKHQ